MRDSIVFYRSFFEAIKELPEANRLEIYEAIFEYGFNSEEVQLKLQGLSKSIFQLIKPQLDANNKRYLNGKKGGRPTNSQPAVNQQLTENKPNQNQNETKTEPKNNQNETEIQPNENENVNVNENENVNENFDFSNNLVHFYDKKLTVEERKQNFIRQVSELQREFKKEYLLDFIAYYTQIGLDNFGREVMKFEEFNKFTIRNKVEMWVRKELAKGANKTNAVETTVKKLVRRV